MNELSPARATMAVHTSLETSKDGVAENATSLFRPALVETENIHSFCLVRKLFHSGMMGTFYAPISLGTGVSIRFDEANRIEGEVVWHQGYNIGIEFLRPIDVTELLQSLSRGNLEHVTNYRSPRLGIEADATFKAHGANHSLQVQDISQRGLKATACSLMEGEEGVIVLAGLQPRKAVVRWSAKGSAGFYFIDPISFEELGLWVLTVQNPVQHEETALRHVQN